MHHTIHSIPASGPERDSAIAGLLSACKDARESEFSEIWVDHGLFPALCALIHGDRGWLMLIRYDGDAGFSSRSADESDVSRTVRFRLGNGQVDEYPLCWTLPTDDVLAALQFFAATGAVPANINWFNDSGDDSAGGPNS